MIGWKWWNQKLWFNVCQHSVLFGSLNIRYWGKMALAWWSNWPLMLTSCWAEPDSRFFDGKQLRRFFWKKNWITNSILFANALWLVLFNRRRIRFRPAVFSASTQTPFRCMVFYGTLISKADGNTCIEFESWLWKNSGALCQVSNGLARSPAIFLARIFFSARDQSFEAIKTICGSKWKLMIVWK